ncbi:hypothetical protein [Dongia rigui]|uniref:Uncharacterized protein n=1 Tax=Dongia rigui TaxID=940149 RepID=A0ABU5DXA7_9PROT|nr:hypothetical protein [Dongia rigui]MDY0871943.1 hypothetical protein [Dongia rigui]
MRTNTRLLTKLRRTATTTALALTVAAVTACAQTRPAPAAGQDPLVISQSTNTALQKYLGLIYPNQRGAFAVSMDGANSYTFYCPDIACTPSLFGSIAVRQCESLSGQPCYLFYVAQDPRMAYTIATTKGVIGRHGIKRGVPTNELPIMNR